jgi:hypothetical protein
VIRFGLRLALRGGREAAVRLVITAAGVALAAGLLLITLAGVNAVNAQNSRYAWLGTGSAATPPARSGAAPGPAAEPLWWRLGADYFGGQVIGRVDVAATGPGSPVPPGIPRLPGPGQFYASPALSRLLRTTPAAQLGHRFPGRQAGLIGTSALPAPNSLIIITATPPASSHACRVPSGSPASRPCPAAATESTAWSASASTQTASPSSSPSWHARCCSRCSSSSAAPPGCPRLPGRDDHRRAGSYAASL